MNEALLNGNPVKASWAAELADSELAKVCTKFTCVDCRAKAYLNRGSSYQAPHFASREHTDNCKAAYQGPSGSDAALVKANTIVIVTGGDGDVTDMGQRKANATSSRRTSLSKGNEAGEVITRRRVDAILQELLSNPSFATSSKKIIVNKVETLASDFFVPFSQLDTQHIGRPIGVWGEAYTFRELSAVSFLNRGDNGVDIRIPNAVFSELKRIYKFTSVTELHGAKFLLIGIFKFPTECRVEDARQLAIQIVTN